MKMWLKNNWKQILISCLLILVPMLVGLCLWNKLPNTMHIHWGADGVADGTGSKAMVVFLIPVILLVVNVVCFLFTAADKGNKDQNPKAMRIIFWIIPILSWVSNGAMYSSALGKSWSMELFMPLLFGVLFLVLGNVMPKVTRNRTFGVKLFWTIYNEENWNKTHRLAGKLWVAGGFACLLTAWLPTAWMFGTVLTITFAIVLIPIFYSYSIYKKHRQAGIVYEIPAKDKKASIAVIALIVVILAFVGILMFTGDISVTCQENAICIEADFYEDLTVPFDAVTEISCRESLDRGMRKFGYSSARLSLGVFENEEFGSYTIYAYNGSDACIVIRGEDKVLVLNGKTPADTQTLYETLLAQMK